MRVSKAVHGWNPQKNILSPVNQLHHVARWILQMGLGLTSRGCPQFSRYGPACGKWHGVVWEGLHSALLPWKVKEGSCRSGKVGTLYNLRKEGQRSSPRAYRRECIPAYTLIFSPEMSSQTADLQNMINLFKLPICGNLLRYVANRKVLQLILSLSAHCPWKVIRGDSLRTRRKTPYFPEPLGLCLPGTPGHVVGAIVKQRQSLGFISIYTHTRLLPLWGSLRGPSFLMIFLSSLAHHMHNQGNLPHKSFKLGPEAHLVLFHFYF